MVLYGPLALTVTMWAFQVPALHALGERWDAVTLSLGRGLLAALAFSLLAVAMTPRGQADGPDALPWTQSALAGALFAGFGLFFSWGAIVGNPVLSATVTAVMPITASLVTWAVLGQRPDRALMLALTLVVPGAILAMPASGAADGDAPVLGLVLILTAQVCWSVYSLAIPRFLPGASAIRSTRISVLWALPFYAVAFLLVWSLDVGRAETTAPVRDAILATATALGPLVLGVICWNLSIRRLGLPFCALFLNAVPVLGTLIAWAFGTEPTLSQAAGVALVILGMGLAQYHRRVLTRGRSPIPRT